MASKIRSEYIKNLVSEKKALDEEFVKSTKESLKNLLGEAVNQNLREILSEKKEETKKEDDTYQKEDIPSTPETEQVTDVETETAEATPEGETETVAGTEDLATDATEAPETGEEDTTWDDELEQFKCGDGEYDCTGMNDAQLHKVFQTVTPEDGVRVVMNGDNLTLTDDTTDKEYIIDLSGEADNNFETDDTTMMNESDNLGYTGGYQDKSAMTMPADDGRKGGMDFDGGVPKGAKNNVKRWVGDAGDSTPYSKEVKKGEEPLYEVCLECDEETDERRNPSSKRAAKNAMRREFGKDYIEDEDFTEDLLADYGDDDTEEFDFDYEYDEALEEQSRFGHGNERGMHKTLKSEKDSTAYGSHAISRDNGEYEGTVEGMNENLRRKANAILAENKQLKNIAAKITKQLNEATVVNSSLAKIIKLVTENSTTKEEKMNIINRFNAVKSINESKALYTQINEELKRSHPINDIKKTLNGTPITESKSSSENNKLVETTLLSDDLKKTISLMERVERLK